MAKAKATETTKDLKAFKAKIEGILHSNGFEGGAAARQIAEAVGEYVGEVIVGDEEEAA